MLSSLNSLGGLSAGELLTLFGADSSASSSSNAASASQALSASGGVSGSSTGDPAKAIKAILAQAQISQSQTAALGGGGWTLSATAEEAYADQAGGASLLSANVTISSPGALQQINDAVSEVNKVRIYALSGNVSNPITVTAADAVNVTIGNGGVTLTTTTQSSGLLNELPSQASIQQAYNWIIAEDKSVGCDGTYNGNFTLVKLPSNALGANGGNVATLATGSDKWELVLSQNSVSATVSDTQIKG